MTTSFKLSLRKGTILVGKWNLQRYRVEALLGEGANGKVFLVQKDSNWYALKIGENSVDLQSEINALRALSKQQALQSEHFLKDVDDFIMPDGREFPFYTMSYVKGTDISTYLSKYGQDWFSLLALNILRRLSKLHKAGWVFGDLKIENIIISEYGHVELIDYGGATMIGKSVKQFTELYDRGYWNGGTRVADPAYDIFSFAVLCIHVLAPKSLQLLSKTLAPPLRSQEELMKLVREVPMLQPYELWLLRALSGQFKDGEVAQEAWRAAFHKGKVRVRRSKTPRWLKALIAVSIISLMTTGFLYLKTYLL